MQSVGALLKQRFDQIVIQNQLLKAGFASLPYLVMRDPGLSLGARLTYAFLLMYGWQEGSAFAGQVKIAADMGVSERHLRRYLTELKEHGYIAIERKDNAGEWVRVRRIRAAADAPGQILADVLAPAAG